jgi:hypothetical protein
MINKPRRMHLDEKILRVPMKIYEERIATCKTCYAYDDTGDGIAICKVIKVPVIAKCALKAGACPMGFWSSNYDN